MKTQLLIFTLLILLTETIKPAPLSDQSKIYLITCTPGDELYSIFGHSAIRVEDPAQNIDLIFNYGTFDFNTPNFYLKFMNGQLDYMLSVTYYAPFVNSYSNEKRGITAHELNLSQKEKQQTWQFLLHNMQPQNRNYRYDFFFDNCATRIRDIFFNIKHIEPQQHTGACNHTFRDYLHQYLQESPWLREGIDLVLGLPADKKATDYQKAFLPDYLDTLFIATTPQSLIKESTTILSAQPEPSKTAITPLIVAIAILLIYIAITVIERQKNTTQTTPDRILFLITGLIGLVIAYLWFVTDHKVTNWNLNILWLMPTNIILAITPRSKIKTKVLRYLYRVTFLLSAIILLFGVIIPQHLPQISYPLALTLLIRLWQYTHWERPKKI